VDHFVKRPNRRADLQEMLDDPSVPIGTRKELLIELDRSNRNSHLPKFRAEVFIDSSRKVPWHDCQSLAVSSRSEAGAGIWFTKSRNGLTRAV